MKAKTLFTLLLVIAGTLTHGCTKDDNDSSSSDDSNGSLPPFRTNCGTVIGTKLENPVDPDEGIRGKVRVAGPNLLIMTPQKGGDILIKLHGLDAPSSSTLSRGAEKTLTALTGERAIFFPPNQECTTQVNNETAMVGQVFTATGESYSETLIKNGYAVVGSDVCDSSLITSCYYQLVDEASQNSAGDLEEFLWKPVSDSNGKLAIHSSPEDTVIKVNGEGGTDFSGGNGYDNLTRFSKPGCSYGKNVTVTITNSQGVPYKINGENKLTIPDGCQRYCLKEGEIVPCAKR